MSTNSVELVRWRDLDTGSGDPEEWPFPDEYVEYAITGDLADRVRRRIGSKGGVVVIREREESGGYTEYTTESYYDFCVFVDNEQVYNSQPSIGLRSIVEEMREKEGLLVRKTSTLGMFQLWLNGGPNEV